jgi:hypothetical protein
VPGRPHTPAPHSAGQQHKQEQQLQDQLHARAHRDLFPTSTGHPVRCDSGVHRQPGNRFEQRDPHDGRKKLTQKQTAGLLKSGVKHPKQYVALRAQGLSKTRAAKTANAKRKKH